MTARQMIVATSLLMSSVALAQDVPATTDEARLAEQRARQAAEIAERMERRSEYSFEVDAEPGEKLAYLGVVVNGIDRSLGDHLELPRGVGLIVDSILPDSAALKAGLQKNDVLHKLNDQLLVNPEQLATLVRIHKPGETVAMSVIRKGKSETISVVLGEREVRERSRNSMVFSIPEFPRTDTPPLPPGVRDELRWLEQREPRIIRIRPGGDRSTVRTTDDRFVVLIERVNGEITAKVQDRAGKTLFEGPLNTDEDKAKLPADLKQSVEAAIADLPGTESSAPPAP